MFHSLRSRIAFAYGLLIVGLIGFGGYYVINFVRQTYLNELRNQLTSEARLVGSQTASQLMQSNDTTGMDEMAKKWSALFQARVTIIALDGTVVGESHEDRSKMDNHLSRQEVAQALQGGVGESIRYSFTVGYQMMYIAVAIQEEGKTIGFARVSLPLDKVQANLDHLRNTILIGALLAGGLSIVIAAFIAQRITKPLRQLTEEALQTSHSELSGILKPRDEIGKLTFALHSMSKQQKQQIEALSHERSKLAAVLEQMTDGVVIVDAESRIRLVNSAAVRLFELNPEIVIGQSMAESLRNHQIVEYWQRSQQSKETLEFSVDLPVQKINLHAVVIPLESSLPGHAMILIQDLTRIRQLETIRRDFISNISHELRTPLASLKSIAETLLDTALDDPPAARRFLQRMDTEVDALTQMVSELLELSRIESGKVPLQFSPVAPSEIVKAAVERLIVQAERAGIELVEEVAEDLPDVLADRPRIEQVVVNLLHNAIKFTPAGGKVIVSAGVDSKIKPLQVVSFSVKDNGVGIATKDLPRIFERFYKADRSRAGGGTGLGLAIAKHQIEAHGGSIWVESIEGQGSTFSFSLPIYNQ
jgi:two-component system phosphate regulon sensor histidine kinase PhoR